MNLISRGLGSAQLFGLRLWLNGNFAPCHLQKICGNYAASYRQTNKTAINPTGGGSDGVQGGVYRTQCCKLCSCRVDSINCSVKREFSPEPLATFSYSGREKELRIRHGIGIRYTLGFRFKQKRITWILSIQLTG